MFDHGCMLCKCTGGSDLQMTHGYKILIHWMPIVKQIIAQDSLEALENLYKNVCTFNFQDAFLTNII